MAKSFQKNKNRRRSFKNKLIQEELKQEPIKKQDNDIKTNKSKPKKPIQKNKENVKKSSPIKKDNKKNHKKELIVNTNDDSKESKNVPMIMNFKDDNTKKNKKPKIKNSVAPKRDKKQQPLIKSKPKKNIEDKVYSKELKILDQREIAVEFNDIFFSYDGTRKTLDNVNFKIYDNEYVCVIGHNGSGKSTISKVLVGLLKPLSGYINIYGVRISYENIKYLRDNVGIIFQNPDSQFIGLTTEDDIAFGLENKKIHPKVMKEIINNVVKIIDIEKFLKKDSVSLSGGQKQRVAIASVLAINPRIMIFDESTSMLDPKGKKELKETILKLKREAKKTIISITHDMDEVLNADKVIVMEKGKVKMIGKPSEIFVDDKKLKSLALDFPFSLKLSTLLKEKNIVKKLSINMDDLVESICKK